MVKASLHRLSWTNLFTILVLILVFGDALLQRFLHGFDPQWRRFPFAGLACVLLVAGKYLADLPMQRRYASEAATPLQQFKYFLPSCVPAFLEFTFSCVVGTVRWIARKPHPKAADGAMRIAYMEKGQYSTLLWMGGISLIGDVPVSALLIGVMTHDPVLRLHAHLAFGAITLWFLVALLGDNYWIRGTAHRIDDAGLHLDIADRFRALVPRDAIERAEALNYSRRNWCIKHGVKQHETLLVTPFDQPNVVLALKPDVQIDATVFKLRRPLPRYLLLYVDEPGSLVRRLGEGWLAPAQAAGDVALAAHCRVL